MKRKLMALCATVVVASVSLTLFGSNAGVNKSENNVSYAQRPQYYNEAADMNTTRNEAADMNSTTGNNAVDDYLDDKTDGLSNSAGLIGGLLGGLGGGSDSETDSGTGGGLIGGLGGIGDMFSGVLGGGSGGGSQSTSSATYPMNDNNVGYIDPVPAVTYIQNQTTVAITAAQQSTPSSAVVSQNETVDASATTNPYKKPAGVINPGDSGEGVKWIQWMFIYTNYGLKGKSVTGVYDEETQEVVKKLQKEKGLTVDGIVNDAVIDKIELLYYEYTVTATTVPQVSVITAPDTIGVTQSGADSGEKTGSLGLTIAILAAIWCVAIIAIMIIFILKKKKKKKANENSTETQASEKVAEATDTPAKTNDMSLSDLFEDANK